MADLRQITFDANVYTIPTGVVCDNALSDTSENPVQNKVVKAAIDGKVDAEAGKGLSTNDLTDELKNQYDGYEARIAELEALLENYAGIILSMSDGTDTVNKMILAKDAPV